MHSHKSTKPNPRKKRLAAINTYYTILVCERLGIEPTKQNRQKVRNVRAGRTNDPIIKLEIVKIQNEARAKEKEIQKLQNSD